MTSPPAPIAALGDIKVTVYHGTRQSLATAILRDGFRPTPVPDQTAAIAALWDIPLADVQEHLATKPNFSTADPDRIRTVSTTASAYRAGSWAERAPEATWDALRAVYLLTHPEDEDRYANSDAADFWVTAQRMDDPPVLVEVRSRLGALQSHGFSAGATAIETIWRKFSERPTMQDPVDALAEAVTGFFDFLFKKTSEWRIGIDDAEFVAVSDPVPFRVSPSLLAYLCGRSVVDLGPPQQCSAEWGPSSSDGQSGGQWWPFNQVWSRLTPHRRAQLEEFAGRSITTR
ncbi:hypothetical protein [[Mycobacterium] burgundiense]|uniref:Uncharacterized protein n=1 Tax=[Mycobacterium] burgundiense TaxID=3064286 RepID=A0ABN9NFR9_9MYCO|nr:hypothetical protein [Mycolicibacterium sp. MU0053]CAJ1505584.1 hypothetical protein MU0053_002972 [Mycolicibacterium sp. MU0053]